MEISQDRHFMSVSEAIDIKLRNKSIEHAVLEILNTCHISITNASRARYRSKLLAANRQRLEASKRGRLAMWQADADKEEFCPCIPHVEDEPLEEYPIEEDPV